MASSDVDTLFDAAFLGRLESLSLLARKIQRGQPARGAEERAARRQRGVRGVSAVHEWRRLPPHRLECLRALAATRPQAFVEEEDLQVHLLLDCSGSMEWGEPVKFDYARRVMAGLAYLALANLDRVSIAPLGGSATGPYPPGRGKHRFLPVLRYLAGCKTSTGSVQLEEAARAWTSAQRRRGFVMWVSDLWGSDISDALKALDRLRHAGHELAVIQVRDPAESIAGQPGEYELQDCETGEVRRVIVSPQMAREYAERFARYEESLGAYARRYALPLLQADTTLDPADLLQRALLEGGFVR